VPDPSVTLRRAAAVVGLSALALSLTGSPAFAGDTTLPQLQTVTEPVAQVLSPTSSPSPSPSPTPAPVPVPEPLQPVVDPVQQALADLVGEEPVGGHGEQPEQVAAPGSGAEAPPAPRPAPEVAAQSSATGGSGSASLGSFEGSPGLSAGSGTVAPPPLGAPLLAAAPGFLLPGLPEPTAAPAVEVAAPRPAPGPAAPPGLPALVVVVAAVAVAAAGAGHVAELRVRRAGVSRG
jgi:hypothetical protein